MAKSKKEEESKASKALLESDSDSESSSSSDSDSSSSSEDKASQKNNSKKGVTFSINKDYAKDYQSRKQREELMKERQLTGDDGNDSDGSESSSSDEDEDADLLTTKLDVDIIKTINALRTKDDKIYDSNVRFFPGSDEESGEETEKNEAGKKKSRPKRVKDVLREQILEQMEEEKDGNEKKTAAAREKTSRLAYDEQQQELRKAFLDTENADDKEHDNTDDEEEEDNFLVIKKRHNTGAEDKEMKTKLDNELKNLEESVLKGKDKKSSSVDNKHQLVDPRGEVEDGEKFLLNFIKNKTWIDKSEDYQMTNESDEESLEQLEKSDDFEAQYNFRFEEAVQQAESTSGANHSIQGYARSQTMNTLRRKDESRRDKRLARQERKAAERKAKEEKLRRLKNAKREEMEKKLKQVRAVLGGGAINNDNSEGADQDEPGSEALEALKDAPIDEAAIMKLLEGDFDPDKFEQSMQQAFGDDFYEKEDSEWKTDEDVKEALKTDGDVDYVEDEDEVDPTEKGTASYDEGGEVYDEETYDGDDDADMNEGETELEKKVRAKMMDKLYELDYEDIVGGMPTRFKYREVEKNDYGLSTEEILLARDHTLKQFVSLKKMAPYREGDEHHVSSRKRRKFREMLQQDIEDAEQHMKEQGITVQDNHDNDNDESGTTKKKKKRRRMKKGGDKEKAKSTNPENEENATQNDGVEEGADDTTEGTKSKRRRKKKGKKLPNLLSKYPSKQSPANLVESTTTIASSSKKSKNDVVVPKTPKVESKSDELLDAKKLKKKEKKKKQKKKVAVEGVSAARLASYDL